MSQKKRDNRNRFRSVTVGFRMSPEENADLNTRVRLSGLTKQDYIICRLQERDVVVQGSPRVYKALKDQLGLVYDELRRLRSAGDVSEELLSTINLIAVTLGKMKVENQKEIQAHETF